MRPLEELPHRFWPADRLPVGVAPRDKFTNQKAAAFKKAYVKVVNPRLKAAGFRCESTRARRVGPSLWEGSWFLAGKYGGTGELVIAAHPVGFPTRNHVASGEPPYDYSQCVFMRTMEICPRHDMFDLGRDLEEGLETARLMVEAFDAQGVAYLHELATAKAQLLAVDATSFDAQLPAVHARLGIRATDSSFETVENSRPELAMLLARLHFEAGNVGAVRGLCELGGAATRVTYADHRVPRRLLSAVFERLARGEGPLHPTEAEKRAAWA